jgi:predicted AAA+ superfamily ATPase
MIGHDAANPESEVQSYLEYLEGAYLVRSLPPFEANLGKRYHWPSPTNSAVSCRKRGASNARVLACL